MTAHGYYIEQYWGTSLASVLVVLASLQLVVLLKSPRKHDVGVVKRLGIPINFMCSVSLLVRAIDPQAAIMYPFNLAQALGLFVVTALIICWLHAFLYSFMYAQYLIAKHRIPKTLWKPFIATSTFLVIALGLMTILSTALDQEIWHSMGYFVISATILALAAVTFRAVRRLTASIGRGGSPSPEVQKQLTYISRVEAVIGIISLAVAVYYIIQGTQGMTFEPQFKPDPEKYSLRISLIVHFVTMIIMISVSWLPLRRATEELEKSTTTSPEGSHSGSQEQTQTQTQTIARSPSPRASRETRPASPSPTPATSTLEITTSV